MTRLTGLPLLWGCALLACEVSNPAYCESSAACPADRPVCAPSHRCVAVDDAAVSVDLAPACQTSRECDQAQPLCDPGDRACRTCQDPGDDALCAERDAAHPRCGANGRCVACRAETEAEDCGGTRPLCGPDGECRTCAVHAECPALVCLPDGSCASESEVVYVDNQECSRASDGSRADPYCQVAYALSHLGDHDLVRVMGSTMPYDGIDIPSGSDIRIVGPGLQAPPSARIVGSGAAGLLVSGAGSFVTLDGFEVTGDMGFDGIRCDKTGVSALSLTVRRSRIHHSGGFGLWSSACELTLDQVEVGPANMGGGLSLLGTEYHMTNCFIVANPGSAVLLGSLSHGEFRHITVAGNVTLGNTPIVECSSGPHLLENSLFWDNQPGPQASLFAGACQLAYVDATALPQGSDGSNRSVAPHFVDSMAGDFHLDATTDNSCCIDQIPTSPVDHDVDGRARPQRSAWDIGAHEVP